MYINSREIGKRVSKLRELQGLNQDQYSERINISRSSLAKIEIGHRLPSLEVLADIADFSGVTLDYLVFGIRSNEKNKKLMMQSVISFLMDVEKEM